MLMPPQPFSPFSLPTYSPYYDKQILEVNRLSRFLKIDQDVPEPVLEPAVNTAKVCHASSTSSLSAFGFESPLIASQLRGWVPALSAS